jgi:hypothetical protein
VRRQELGELVDVFAGFDGVGADFYFPPLVTGPLDLAPFSLAVFALCSWAVSCLDISISFSGHHT